MHARIEIRPLDSKGRDLLDRLQAQLGISPESRLPNGTRVYWEEVGNKGPTAFVPDLDKLDPNWRKHLAYVGVNAA